MKKILHFLERSWVWLKYHLYFDDFCIFLFFCLVLFLLMLAGCKSPKTTENTVVRYIDSTVISYRDSIIEIEVPREKIVDIVAWYDTLKMQNSLAQAQAYVDTNLHVLKGSLETKPDAVLTKTVYLPSEERIVYRDSITEKKIPVKVEVVKYKTKTPKFIWWLIGVLSTAVIFAYRKYIAKLFKLLLTLI